jgi:hypothetical protein
LIRGSLLAAVTIAGHSSSMRRFLRGAVGGSPTSGSVGCSEEQPAGTGVGGGKADA